MHLRRLSRRTGSLVSFVKVANRRGGYKKIAISSAVAVDRILLIFSFDDLRLQNHPRKARCSLPAASKQGVSCNLSDHIRKPNGTSTIDRRNSRAKKSRLFFASDRGLHTRRKVNNLADAACSKLRNNLLPNASMLENLGASVASRNLHVRRRAVR
jgi:hypothetical protein